MGHGSRFTIKVQSLNLQSFLIQARIGKIIYGAEDTKRGALGGTINLADHKSAHHNMIIERGLMEEESRKIIVDWFKEKRVLSRESLLSKLR